MTMKAVVGGVLAFVGGIAVGILYAPAAGATTRRRLSRKGRQLGDKAAEVVDEAGELVERTRRRFA